jgi:hypothetical protein
MHFNKLTTNQNVNLFVSHSMSHVNIKLSHKQTPRKLTHLNTYGDLHIHTVNELSLPKLYITAFCKYSFVKFSKTLRVHVVFLYYCFYN